MTIASANEAALRFGVESTYNTAPANMQVIEATSEDFQQNTQTTRSRKIRADRQSNGAVRTGVNATGTLNGELSYGTFDDLFESLFQSAGWSSAVTVISASVNVAFTASGAVVDLSTGSWTNTPTVGAWLQIAGSTSNNVVGKVATATTNQFTLTFATLQDEAEGDSVTITQGAQIVNGTTFSSFHFERQYTDLSSEYVRYGGMSPNTFEMAVGTANVVTVAFGFLGSSELSATSAVDASPTAATTTEVMNTVDHVSSVFENGSSVQVTSINLRYNNNLGERLAVGTFGAISLRSGTIEVGGAGQAYYESKALADRSINFTTSSIVLVFTDAAGNVYVFDVPATKITTNRRNITGQNADVFNDFTFEAQPGDGGSVTMRLVRFPAS